ncbi:MAG: hypothetical protein KAW12_28730 [Candidatus Aminicenantes bacterium]|nr:hypothetical protein [Candidatus Aminicenantes bacterium]
MQTVTVEYKINILGLKTRQGAISISALKEIADAILKSSDRTLRLFVEGKSTKRGKSPSWLKKTLDFTITGIKTGSTVLELEAPLLGETLPEPHLPPKLWENFIKPDDTAISLLSKSFSDAAAENMESDYFDVGVLNALLSFNSITTKYAEEVRISSKTKTKDNFKINGEVIQKIKKIKIETPKPNTIAISGFFNLIEHSSRKFQLKLGDSGNLEGTMDPLFADFENMRNLWGKKVTIKGKAHYKPSGKLRSIEAQLIKPFEPGDEVLQHIPANRDGFKFTEEFLKEKNSNRALKKTWGKWPGDESIEELLAAL